MHRLRIKKTFEISFSDISKSNLALFFLQKVCKKIAGE